MSEWQSKDVELNRADRRARGREAGALLRRIASAGSGADGCGALPATRKPPAVEPWPRPRVGLVWESIGQEEILASPKDSTADAPATPKAARHPLRRGYRRILGALALVIVALGCALAPRLGWPISLAQSDGGEPLEASGVIRADEILVGSEVGGRIAAVTVEEGASVRAGDLLLRLDAALLDAQIEAARAAVDVAEAGLIRVQAGARPGQIAVAQAELAQARAAHAAASQAVSDTLALLENPQELRMQIAVTQAQVEAARHEVARAVALKEAAEVGKDRFEEVKDKAGAKKILLSSGPVGELPAILPPEIVAVLPSLGDGVHSFDDMELHLHGGTYDLYQWITIHIPLELHLMPNNWWQAWVGVNAAVAEQEGIEASLAQFTAQRAHPQELEARADEAISALAQAEARVAAALARLNGLEAGASAEQIAALESRVSQARAALDALVARREQFEIAAPVDGVVLEIAVHPGEVTSAGSTLLTLADLSVVRLVVYLPETELGRVRLDLPVQVTVDSFPDRRFDGQVVRIGSSAEFTPRNVSTEEERVNLVFAVEVRLPNPDGALKPGMPADALFGR